MTASETTLCRKSRFICEVGVCRADWILITPRFKRVTFGPPIVNAEKLLALIKAGVVDFSVSRNPRIVMNEQLGCYEIRG